MKLKKVEKEIFYDNLLNDWNTINEQYLKIWDNNEGSLDHCISNINLFN